MIIPTAGRKLAKTLAKPSFHKDSGREAEKRSDFSASASHRPGVARFRVSRSQRDQPKVNNVVDVRCRVPASSEGKSDLETILILARRLWKARNLVIASISANCAAT